MATGQGDNASCSTSPTVLIQAATSDSDFSKNDKDRRMNELESWLKREDVEYLWRLDNARNLVLQSRAPSFPNPSQGSLQFDHRPVLILVAGGTLTSTLSSEDKLVQCAPGDLFRALQGIKYFQNRIAMEPSPNRPPPNAKFVIYEMNPRIDSTEATLMHWNLIASELYFRLASRENGRYKGAVVIHGTDTLAHFAAAMSFMLWNFTLPIIITGSQQPIFNEYTDAVNNLIGACQAANGDIQHDEYNREISPICGVFVFFDQKLLIGTRVVKIHSLDFDAFDSPNVGPVAYCRGKWVANKSKLESIREGATEQKKKHQNMLQFIHPEIRIHIVTLCPGFESSLIPSGDNICQWRDCNTEDKQEDFVKKLWGIYHGILLLAYGSGNAPESVRRMLKIARTKCHIPVAFVTQCIQGSSQDQYGVAIRADEAVCLHDCTVQAAYAKMAVTISRVRYKKKDYSLFGVGNQNNLQKVDKILKECIRGEFTDPLKSKAIDESVALYH